MLIHQADCSGSPFASLISNCLSPTSQDASARKGCQKPGSRERWISSGYVVSWDATAHHWCGVGRPGGLSFTLVCAPGLQSSVLPCAEVNSCSAHNNTSRAHPTENTSFFSGFISATSSHLFFSLQNSNISIGAGTRKVIE